MLQSSLIIPSDFPSAHHPRVFFYQLVDPITSEICYIGKTEKPKARYKQHCRAGYFDGNAYKDIWIADLVFKQDRMPIMNVFAWIDDPIWTLAGNHEINLINKFWNDGHPLLNRRPKRKHGIWQARIRNARFYQERKLFFL